MKEHIILLHGALGSENQFSQLKESLADKFEVHSMNFEGHGGKTSNKAFSTQLFTENLATYLKENSIQNTHIFGYSMGGYVALNAALQIPEKIQSIYTLGTKFNWSIESAAKEVRMLNPQKIEEKVPKFAKRLADLHFPLDWKEIMNKTGKMMNQIAEREKLKEIDFKRIKHKVTIGVGSLDNMVSYEESLTVANQLTNSKLIELNNVKHPIESLELNTLLNFIDIY